MEKILIKGAGDLASGIAWRLQRAGFPNYYDGDRKTFDCKIDSVLF